MVFKTAQVREWEWVEIGVDNSPSPRIRKQPRFNPGLCVYERKAPLLLYYNCDMEKYADMSDEQLAIKVRSLDQDLYRYLVTRYQAKLTRYSNYLVHDEQKASDVVQETFIKAFINLNSFNPNKKFSSWIYRIAHNEAMNLIKKYHREQPMNLEPEISSAEDLVEEFTKNEIINKARSCLHKIPVLYSEPLSLFYLEDRSYEEISDILRLPIGTVGTRINRAKILMKKICQKNN